MNCYSPHIVIHTKCKTHVISYLMESNSQLSLPAYYRKSDVSYITPIAARHTLLFTLNVKSELSNI